MHLFQLVQDVGAVGIEVDLRLLEVQAGHRADIIPLFHDTQTFAGQFERRTEVAEADLLADQVVVFARKVGNEILDCHSGVQFSQVL